MSSKIVKAYAIHQIGTRINGQKTFIKASERNKPSIFLTNEDELKRLEKLGAAREATKEEVAVAEVQESIVDATNKDAPAPAAELTSTLSDEKPASGAAGDPTEKPSKPVKAAEKPTEPASEKPAEKPNTPAGDDSI